MKKIIIGVSALAILAGLAFLYLSNNNPGPAPLPKEIILESPDEAKKAVSDTSDATKKVDMANTKEFDAMKATTMSGSTWAIVNQNSVQKRIAELKKNGKEYLEDYIEKTYKGDGKFDTQKLLSLPLGDAGYLERFLDTLSESDTKSLEKIGTALVQRKAYGLEFEENSLEGYLAGNYQKEAKLDYEKMKGMPILNDLGLLITITEIYYSPFRSKIDANLEGVIAHKVNLIPKGNLTNQRYRNLMRVHSFFQVANGKEKIGASRSLRESQSQYLLSWNYPLLTSQSDKDLFSEGSRLLEKYKSVTSIEEAMKMDYRKDIVEGNVILEKMESSGDFKTYYMGIAVVNQFLAALEILNNSPENAIKHVKRNEAYVFTTADGTKRKPLKFGQDWNYSMAYEALGDKSLAGGDKVSAKKNYETSKAYIDSYIYTRPYYVLPRNHSDSLASKIKKL